eukprot:COSAG01_NODE_1910_length_8928_cov_33.079964_11_plen_69_part_00
MWVCLGDSSDRLFQGDDDTGYQKFWAKATRSCPVHSRLRSWRGHLRVPERRSKEHGRDQVVRHSPVGT